MAAAALSASCGGATGADDKEYAEQLLSNLSEIEQAALADKEVTFGEYESSVQHVRECLAGLGAVVDQAELGPDGLLTYTFTLEGYETDAELAEFETRSSECSEQADAVQAVYTLNQVPSETEIAAAESEFRTCVDRLNIDFGTNGGFTDDDSVPEMMRRMYEAGADGLVDPEAGMACIEIVAAVSARPVPGLADVLAGL